MRKYRKTRRAATIPWKHDQPTFKKGSPRIIPEVEEDEEVHNRFKKNSLPRELYTWGETHS